MRTKIPPAYHQRNDKSKAFQLLLEYKESDKRKRFGSSKDEIKIATKGTISFIKNGYKAIHEIRNHHMNIPFASRFKMKWKMLSQLWEQKQD